MILDAILASKRAEIAKLGPVRPRQAASPLPVLDLIRRPGGEALRLIAEVKFKSPSAGILSSVLTTGERASAYAEGGASMISVLCDGPFFGGGFGDLRLARVALGSAKIPLLAKEFVIDERQIEHAYAHGADAVLLIVRILDLATLQRLHAHARVLGLTPLVEVANDEELDLALTAGAQFIGINARDLDTLAIDMDRAAALLERIPPAVVSAHLSGVKSSSDVARIAATRADAALIGEILMRQDDPGPLLREFVKTCVRPVSSIR